MSLLPLLRTPRCIDRFMAKRHCRMDSRSSTWNQQPVTQQVRSRLCFVGSGCVSSKMHFWVISSKRSQISKSDSRRLFLNRKTSKYQRQLPKHQVVFFTSQAPTHFQSHLVYPFFRNAWNKPMSIVGKTVPNGKLSPKKIVFQKALDTKHIFRPRTQDPGKEKKNYSSSDPKQNVPHRRLHNLFATKTTRDKRKTNNVKER